MNEAQNETDVFRPRAAYAVAVTGHRPARLDAAKADANYLRQTLSFLLNQIADGCREARERCADCFSNAPVELRLISALAAGSDQIATTVAREQGWSLDACLPFDRQEYARDFDDEASRTTYEHFLADARCVFELHGSRKDEQSAYEKVGRMMLDQCDLLIAIWDGDPARGRGGTGHVVAEAIAHGIPVVRIDPTEAVQPQLMWSGLDKSALEELLPESVPCAPAALRLKSLVVDSCQPPTNPVDLHLLKKYFAGDLPPRRRGLSYPVLLFAAGVRRPQWKDFSHSDERASGNDLGKALESVATSPLVFSDRLENLVCRYARADAAALNYSRLHRSAFVGNFALAALAVLLALAGLVIPMFKVALVVAELLVVVSILVRTRTGTQGGWHEMWLDNRHLAERLRALSLSSLVGDLGLRDSEQRDAAAIPGWVAWYSRATAREIGLLCRCADRPYLEGVRAAALVAIERQIRYQGSNAAAAHTLDVRLERAGELLFGATIVACAVWLMMKVTGAPMHISGEVSATEILMLLTGFLPALGAALYGMRMQSDLAGQAARAYLTADRLSRLAESIGRDAPTQERLSARLRRLADIMLADVERWRATYKVRQLSLPA